jgi:hypothetical protein
MELLIVKSNKDYFRFKEEGSLLVKMDKASVFPMNQIDIVKQHESRLIQEGFKDVCIKKLVLSEEDL